MCASLGIWLALRAAEWDRVIYHDAWFANFPIMFAVAKNMACTGMADWLGSVDSGTPVSLYVATSSITNPVRLALLFLMSCVNPGVKAALYFHEFHIFVLYLLFATGMYVLGRVLYRHAESAVYLMTTTLFAGLCLESAHSDQALTILFWVPWIVGAFALFRRRRKERSAHWYLNAAVLLGALEALDETPHFTAFAVGLASIIYVVLDWQAFSEGLRIHWKHLWPALLVLAVTGLHLQYLLGVIGHFSESQRYAASSHTGLQLELSHMSETGFAQPTAFLGTFLPLSFTRAFDVLADNLRAWYFAHVEVLQSDRRFFVYQLDEVMFFVGIIPAALAAVFLMRTGAARLRAGWGLFALLTLLAALQQSRLYLLIFELPFFDIFRSYLLLLLFVVFAVLVMSGYGMDVLLELTPKERRRLAGRALAVTAGLGAVAGIAFAWMHLLPAATEVLPAARFAMREPYFPLRYAALLDGAILLAGLGSLAWAACVAADVRRGMSVVIFVLALSQAAYQAGVYRILSIPAAEAIARFGLDAADRTPLPPAVAEDPNARTRKLCEHFAECYLSRRDTASLRLDHGGTFFRGADEAVFQPGLARPVVEALSAVGRPVFWTSRRAEPYGNAGELTERLNAHAADIGDYLGEVVAVRASDLERLGRPPQAGRGTMLSHLSRGIDRLRLSYSAPAGAYLNAAITYDPHWRVEVDGNAVVVVRGNFDGIAVALPPGSGSIAFRYVDRAGELFFASRILMGLAGLAIALWLAARVSVEPKMEWRCLADPVGRRSSSR